MGAVLEMTVATRLATVLIPLAAVAACGSLDTTRTSVAGQLVTSLFSSAPQAAAPLTRAGFTPADLRTNPDGFQLVTVDSMGLGEPARLIASANGRQTWEGESGFTATYQDGILATTHGLIFDLISADGSATLAAMRAGGGDTARSIEVMDSQDQLTRIDFACTVSDGGPEAVNLGTREVTARRFTESCRSPLLVIENRFWLDGSGGIIASLQYVSPTVAYLRSNRL